MQAARVARSDQRAVESSASTQDALVRPWRTATIVASLVAVMELRPHPRARDRPFRATAARLGPGDGRKRSGTGEEARPGGSRAAVQPPAAPAKPKLARTETSVLVLNGNGVAGAAAIHRRGSSARRDTSSRPWVTQPGDYRRSVVMYRPGYAPEAARFARDLRVKMVSPLDGLR